MFASEITQLTGLAQGELILETTISYDGITPVRIRAKRSDGRFDFSDLGGAVAAADVDPARIAFPERIAIGDCSVNITRQGVVWLPGFARSSEQWLAKLPELVAEGSIALYETLLELVD